LFDPDRYFFPSHAPNVAVPATPVCCQKLYKRLADSSVMRYNRAMEPAQTIIRKLGGPSVVARVVGVHRTRVSSWKRSRASGGTDGQVPQRHISKLFTFAREQDVELSVNDFIKESGAAR